MQDLNFFQKSWIFIFKFVSKFCLIISLSGIIISSDIIDSLFLINLFFKEIKIKIYNIK